MITAEDAALIAALRGESARLQKQATAIEFDAQDLAYQAREIEDQYEQETTSDEASNEIGDRCSSCRWLHTKDTIDWSGACGKYVTVKRCISMHQCHGPERAEVS